MQRVRFEVARLRRYASDVRFEVFGDLGSGEIDYDHALTPSPVRLWSGAPEVVGNVLDGHLTGRHLDHVWPDGHLSGVHLGGEHLYPAVVFVFDSPAYVFGRFQHAVVMSDGAGNSSSVEFGAVIVNSGPKVPQCVARGAYDAATDRQTLTFESVRFGPIVGG
jgi:hypothetical protein